MCTIDLELKKFLIWVRNGFATLLPWCESLNFTQNLFIICKMGTKAIFKKPSANVGDTAEFLGLSSGRPGRNALLENFRGRSEVI